MAPSIRGRRGGEKERKEEVYRDLSRGGIRTLYLCCVFAPGKEFFQNNLDYFSKKAEWVQANNELEAIKAYRGRHYGPSNPEGRYVKVLGKMSPASFYGEKAIDAAREIMQEYYIYQQYAAL